MKLLALTLFVAAMGFVGGCTQDTPAYSAKERWANIGRNMDYEVHQGNDDIDHVLLLRPSNELTIWNVQHND